MAFTTNDKYKIFIFGLYNLSYDSLYTLPYDSLYLTLAIIMKTKQKSHFSSFNKIIIIESLFDADQKTGSELKNDVLRWKEFNEDFNTEAKFLSQLEIVQNKEEFISVLNKIKNDCKNNNIKPILHFEIHGAKEKDGLILKSGEKIKWKEIGSLVREINIIIKNNLFFTMAVCFGANLFEIVSLDKPAPFIGLIGSTEEIDNKNDDLTLRYQEFYKELLDSFDITLAFEALKNANPSMVNRYNYIECETAFKIIYKNYIIENTSEDGIKKRIEQVKKDENMTFISSPRGENLNVILENKF